MQRSCSHDNAFCSMMWLTRMYLRKWQHQMTTIMQPFQCDLQPQIQETHRTTHTDTTTRCRTQRRNQFADETTPAALAAHRRYLSSPAATTLHGKMHGFVLRLPPQHKPHATFMQPSQCILQHDVANPHVSTQMATPDDNNQAAIPMRSATTRFKRRIELRTQTQPLVAEHGGGANSRMKRPQPHPPHTGGTFHRRLQPLYTEKTHGFVLRLPPLHKPHATFMQPSQCILQHEVVPRNITSLCHHFPLSPLPKATISLGQHFP